MTLIATGRLFVTLGVLDAVSQSCRTEYPTSTHLFRSGGPLIPHVPQTCALLSFYGLAKPDETDPPGYVQRFNAVHADLKNYLARLPPPHPTFIETVPLEDGCPYD
jgi:hypothetical protein